MSGGRITIRQSSEQEAPVLPQVCWRRISGMRDDESCGGTGSTLPPRATACNSSDVRHLCIKLDTPAEPCSLPIHIHAGPTFKAVQKALPNVKSIGMMIHIGYYSPDDDEDDFSSDGFELRVNYWQNTVKLLIKNALSYLSGSINAIKFRIDERYIEGAGGGFAFSIDKRQQARFLNKVAQDVMDKVGEVYM